MRIGDLTAGNGSGFFPLVSTSAEVEETLWTDDTNAYFVRTNSAGVITWRDMAGAPSAAPGAGARPSAGSSGGGGNANGQAAMAASAPVVIAADQNFPCDVQTNVTRPANTTAYTAWDVVGGPINLGVMGPSGRSILITSLQLQFDIAAIPSGMLGFILHLYSVTPPSALADNAAFDLPVGDRASYLGNITIPAPTDLGATLYSEVNSINKQVKLAGTNLFGILQTVGAYTPAANSEVFRLTAHTVAI